MLVEKTDIFFKPSNIKIKVRKRLVSPPVSSTILYQTSETKAWTRELASVLAS